MRAVREIIALFVIGKKISGESNRIAPASPNTELIIRNSVSLDDPVLGLPFAAERGDVAAKGDARTVVVVEIVSIDQRVAGGAADNDDATMAKTGFGRIVIAVC